MPGIVSPIGEKGEVGEAKDSKIASEFKDGDTPLSDDV
jgi:hypothetical protein